MHLFRLIGRRAALLTAVTFAVTTVGVLATPLSAAAWSSGSYSSASESDLVARHNRARANAGLKALKVDSTLRSIARGRSKDMIVRDYFSHSIPPSGKKVFDIMQAKGYCFVVAGENIGWNSYPDGIATEAIHKMFMKSDGHRRNILGKAWDVIGIGAYKGPSGRKMWTVLFADKCGSTSGSKPKATPKPTPKPTAKPKPKVASPRSTPSPTTTRPPATKPAPTPTPTPTPSPTPTPTPQPTPTPIPTPTPTPTPIPTPTPTPTPVEPAYTVPVSGGTLRVEPAPATDPFGSLVGPIAAFFFGR